MSATSAVFVGDGSLLIQCADAYRQAGHDIRAVASRNRAVLEWASNCEIPTAGIDADALAALAEARFDYLFSIANTRVLPIELVSRARKLAINFHDAPLPRYAGLHATSWALIAQEKEHGVTWHEMRESIDTGRIVRQLAFPVAPDETAFGLNARCYEAGLASFMSMLEDIGRDELALTEQRGVRSYFAAARRPPALATLDFSRPAAELAALVRGLDFGPYPNPLTLAKIHLDDTLLLVRFARALGKASSAPAGTVLRIEGETLHVATPGGDLELGGCCNCHGRPGTHGLAPGRVLRAPDDALLQSLAARIPQVAASEGFWTESLAALAPVELPYPRSTSAAVSRGRFVQARLDVPACGATTAAGFFAWLSALTGQENVSLLYCDAVLAEEARPLEAWLSPWVPLTLATAPKSQVQGLQAAAEMQIAKMRKAGPCPRDLAVRLGLSHCALERLSHVGLSFGGAPVPDGIELLLTVDPSGQTLELVADSDVFPDENIRGIAGQLAFYLKAFAAARGEAGGVPLVPAHEPDLLAMNASSLELDTTASIHQTISAQVARTPGHTAIRHAGQAMSYRELDERASAVAALLLERGVRPGDVVGLCLGRTPDMVIAMLAVLKAGAAYLPLDPDYPRERILFMIEDSGAGVVIASEPIAASLAIAPAMTFVLDAARSRDTQPAATLPIVAPECPAYVIYTSGSTGRPKGVVVTHRNVINFFAGMSQRIPHDPPGRWLAVTSLSFDISVLELLWTLTAGFTVEMHSNPLPGKGKPLDFSLCYFASDDSSGSADRYKLLLEGAKFADQAGFSAIWTPERHFHAFGGLYPNPALTSAAIAAVTSRLKIRAGSCVLPLHHPIRVAEEWAFVDNISQGRVGVSFASGWQPNDFVLAPSEFANRKTGMLANIDVVRRLWRGESVAFPGPLGKDVQVRTLPRPIQKELPVWITAAGNPETFQQAGELGCHLLTHLLGQKIEEVARKVSLYRDAWRKAGHPGEGHVTLMLHTFIGQDEQAVRETVREPMKAYLRSSVDLIRQAAWTFPTFVQRASEDGKSPAEIMDAQPLSSEEMDALLEHAFSRYYGTSALFGTPRRCMAMVEQLDEAGIDEIACLIDFGVEADTVLAHLHDLKSLMDQASTSRGAPRGVSVAEPIVRQEVTHLQCTPSMAAMLVADAPGRAALSRLQVLMVGGEALPRKLAEELSALVPGRVLNMYGPTETTVWSSTCDLSEMSSFVPLGRPIANTSFSIRTPWGMECPALVPGELLIGGAGVAQGYWGRPELTAERFVSDPATPGSRWYRSGDLVRRHPGGAIEFLGRMDHQVKVRGHRIELGEIESALSRQPGVKQVVVLAREAAAGDQRLVAYVVPQPGATTDSAQLREALARELPAIMVPATILMLQALPTTPNGKVDRHALPAPQPELAVRPAAAQQSELEKMVSGIWQEVLGVAQVGLCDNFFDLGGHSLLVVQVQRRLREVWGHEVSITDMFRLPTVRALAAHLGGNAPRTAVDDGLERANTRRLMRSQKRAQPAAV
jgi:natural product biosynthesis luciferase-like monooxygenase protein